MSSSKYRPLFVYLQSHNADEITLTLHEIEELLGVRLPQSARTQRAWWSNRSRGAVQARAWMDAGYNVAEIDFAVQRIIFRKPTRTYHVSMDGDIPRWTGNLVRGLRDYLNLSQAELAQQLGMRQQTISEWETGIYAPKRSSSKLLTFFAEREGFPYQTDKVDDSDSDAL